MSAILTKITTHSEHVVDTFDSVNRLSKNTTEQTAAVSTLADEQLATMREFAVSTEALTTQLTRFKL